MKKIVAFGASSSLNSINKDLAAYTASQVPDSVSIVVNLIDFEMPIYSTDKENENGIPDLAYKFKDILKNARAGETWAQYLGRGANVGKSWIKSAIRGSAENVAIDKSISIAARALAGAAGTAGTIGASVAISKATK